MSLSPNHSFKGVIDIPPYLNYFAIKNICHAKVWEKIACYLSSNNIKYWIQIFLYLEQNFRMNLWNLVVFFRNLLNQILISSFFYFLVHTLPNLTVLSLSGCSKITDDGIELIAENLRKLRSLDISWWVMLFFQILTLLPTF